MSPKLSDSLRAMADRAPVDDASISAAAAIRSVKTRRALRVTANSVVGAGAAAALTFAIVMPTLNASDGYTAGAGVPEIAANGGYVNDLGGPGDARLAFGVCGAPVGFPAEQPGTLVIVNPPADAVAGGASTTLDVTLTASEDLTGQFGVPSVLVVWNGIVVGTSSPAITQVQDLSLAAGESTTGSVELELVNCWDDTALPGGVYQLVAAQDVFTSASEPAEVPPASEGEATAEAGVIEPDATVSFDAGYTFLSDPVEITVDGKQVDDPFGQYLNPAQPELPSDFLTPQIAREMYQKALVTGTWDMAKGTQRVVVTSDSASTNQLLWEQNYFGCAWDGGAARPFPTASADLRLLDVTGTLPAQVSLSYGWIVDGNPLVDLAVTNVSGHSMPQMYEPNTTLVFVKNDRVVGEAYLTNVNRNAQYAEAPFFAAGAQVGGQYVWRDVNGCWSNTGELPLEPGTYTVLNSQYLYLTSDSYGVVPFSDAASSYYPGTVLREGAASLGGDTAVIVDGDGDRVAIDVLPEPQGQWLEMQIWTSLGTVTITS